MKNRIFIIHLFIVATLHLFAADYTITIPVQLKWKGTEVSYSHSSSHKELISFENAKYLSNDLPYYYHSEEMQNGYTYSPYISNPVFVPASEKEVSLLNEVALTGEVEVKTFISNYRGNKKLNIYILPFIIKENQILKLSGFDLNIDKNIDSRNSFKKSNRTNYTNVSVLANGTFYKIKVYETGVYKITYDELRAAGIEPANVRIFGYGGGVLEEDFSKTYWDDLPEIPIYDNGSYILFYGEGLTKWSYNYDEQTFQHTANTYATYGCYFITSSIVGEKRRIAERTEVSAANPNDVYQFTDYKVHEKDSYNFAKTGKQFYGERFNSTETLSYGFSFFFPNIARSVKVKIDVAAKATATSTFTLKTQNQSNSFSLAATNTNIYFASVDTQQYEYNSSDGQLNLTLTYTSPNSLAEGYLNYIELVTKRYLNMYGNCMIFHNTENIQENSYNRYNLTTSNSNILVWDITDPVNVEQVKTNFTGSSFQFIDEANKVKSYIAIDPYDENGFLSVAKPYELVANQNIHGASPIDMLIISHPLFINEANTLAQAHYSTSGLKVGVYTPEQIYNEFSSGKPDATAYRRAAKMFYDKSQNEGDKLRYLLLFGKGSYDNRGIIQNSGYNYILTYQSNNSHQESSTYVTDDYYGYLDDNEGVDILNEGVDIGIGRFPVVTVEQAQNVVNKTTRYMKNEDKGAWKNQLCFIADDGGDGQLKGHIEPANRMADSIRQNFSGYQVNKIFLDAYQQETNTNGESYPLAKNRFQNLLRTGLFLINYMGHANANGWGNENMLTIEDAKTMQNTHLPLFTTGSCSFSEFDQDFFSGGEELLLNPNGGGIGTLAVARIAYSNINEAFLKNFYPALFSKVNKNHIRVGDALAYAKNKEKGKVNVLNFIYFGDPALMLNYPDEYEVKVASVNKKDISESDTLKALSKALIEGIIVDVDGNFVEDFNGNIKVAAYDKEQKISTLDNHKEDFIYTFNDRPNTLFNGIAKVNNGKFSVTFMLPKDIRYNYGTGRLNFYAWEDEKEAQGYFEDFIVGGSNDDYIREEDGPAVNMYLNYEGFISGTRVNEEPLFVANLYDINGINTSGSTGHDIVLCITQNGEEKFRYILNDYYEAEQDSYQKGKITFKLSELAEGTYTLSFKVWDLLNNSTVKTLDFEVVKGLSPVIYSVINYPNPASEYVDIEVVHTRQTEKITMNVDIFDLSGRKIYSFGENSESKIRWNLRGGNGEKVQPGMYIYRVSIKENNKIKSHQSDKIIIK